jgi:hypothetical protein
MKNANLTIVSMSFVAGSAAGERTTITKYLIIAGCRRNGDTTSRALPWFESYVGRHRSSQMPLRNACLVTFNEGTVMIGFMESVV